MRRMPRLGVSPRNRLRLWSLLLVLLIGSQLTTSFTVTPTEVVDGNSTSAAQAQYAQLPLAFEPNQGQVDPSVQYLVRHGQATTHFAGTDTVTSIGDERVTMSLDGANQPLLTGTDQLEGKTNYFIGNDQSKWQSDIPNYQSILAQNVYPGIDLRYYGNNSQLEHDFIVAPGIDPKQIAFSFAGQQDLILDGGGNLILKLNDTDLTLQAPISYQQEDGGRRAVTSSFELSEDKTVTVALGDYDSRNTLVIDPVLIYSTYLGGSGNDQGQAITTDASGNAYIVGSTASTDFPTASPYQAANAGGASDVFISKLNPSGSALVYSTYLGGSGSEDSSSLLSVAVDLSGNAYIAGSTASTDFPTASAYQASYAGSTTDAFLTKLNPAGSALIYSTYLGGSGIDTAGALAVDTSGSAYVAGITSSTNFPLAAAYDSSINGVNDAFVTKFNATGSALVYSTYLGGSGLLDVAESIAVDSAGNLYVGGDTASTDFPTVSPFQAANAGLTDAFVTKFNASGSALVYSTYVGGSGEEYLDEMTIDTSGYVYLVGDTASTNFPTASPYQAANAGGANDVFVTKLNLTGSSLVHSTYLGGSGTDIGNDIAVGLGGEAYVIGRTASTDFPTASPYQAANAGGANDVYVAKFNAAGSSLAYSTYLGSTGDDVGRGIWVGLNGDAYITGNTSSTSFPTQSPFQAANAGGTFDAFIAQLTEHTVNLTAIIDPYINFSLSTTTCDLGIFSTTQTKFCTHTIGAGSNASNGYVISYIPTTTLTSGAITITAMATQTTSVLDSEQFGLNLKANTAAGSFTATDFGANASGGSGVAMTGYNTANQFKFVVAGDTIAETTAPSNLTTFTASYIANVQFVTEPGTYSTPVTYNIVASY